MDKLEWNFSSRMQCCWQQEKPRALPDPRADVLEWLLAMEAPGRKDKASSMATRSNL
jgi:hypothetical protein